ncbi:M20/M25/M40 family metallo-hydrolase [uncultured Roseobacter sp.]|uniref:M20/M25/M40 family metallo-hydrolase n=1 Tax=uncultured Roseobacter sp. TaxID=114847 RepID=UPI002637C630|nr:M20/M25/M40 family metallo-hydrolase [uncultured Roseobacter sp.]
MAKKQGASGAPTGPDEQELARQYVEFLGRCKTGVEVCDFIHEEALAQGFLEKGQAHDKGALRLSLRFNDRCGVLFSISDFSKIGDGLKILGSHVDSPRLDLKPAPPEEKFGVGTLQTRYYGGIKKHHWVGIPLELHGRGRSKSGARFAVKIGRQADDPVFTISDLAPHLGHQPDGGATNSSQISAEHLNVIAGLADPDTPKDKKSFAEGMLAALGLEAGDFVTGEFEAVPAMQPRFVGFEKKMIGAYGHDNRACTFASLKAFLEMQKAGQNCAFIFTDREEVGSQGVHGADSNILERFLFEVFEAFDEKDYFLLRKAISNSVMLSGDVNVALDPSWPGPTDERNSGHLGKGVCIAKYTGSRGKRMASEADSSLVSQMRNIMIEDKLPWQPGELGKVDFGGGGTVAMHFARQGVQVFDMGPPILSMHSPYEVMAVADLQTTYLAYKAFLERFVIEDPVT